MDAPISAFIPTDFNDFNLPFVLRQQPHVILQGERPLQNLSDNLAIENSM